MVGQSMAEQFVNNAWPTMTGQFVNNGWAGLAIWYQWLCRRRFANLIMMCGPIMTRPVVNNGNG